MVATLDVMKHTTEMSRKAPPSLLPAPPCKKFNWIIVYFSITNKTSVFRLFILNVSISTRPSDFSTFYAVPQIAILPPQGCIKNSILFKKSEK